METRIKFLDEEILNGINKYNELIEKEEDKNGGSRAIKFAPRFFENNEDWVNRSFEGIVDYISNEAGEPEAVEQFVSSINTLLKLAYMAGQMNQVVYMEESNN